MHSGWTGGKFGVGRRCPLPATRAIINAIHDGSLAQAQFEKVSLNLAIKLTAILEEDLLTRSFSSMSSTSTSQLQCLVLPQSSSTLPKLGPTQTPSALSEPSWLVCSTKPSRNMQQTALQKFALATLSYKTKRGSQTLVSILLGTNMYTYDIYIWLNDFDNYAINRMDQSQYLTICLADPLRSDWPQAKCWFKAI